MGVLETSNETEIANVKAAVNQLLSAMGVKPLPDWSNAIEIKLDGLNGKILTADGHFSSYRSISFDEHQKSKMRPIV